MTKNEKCVVELDSHDIKAIIENNTTYICVNHCELELSQFEINFRSKLYDEQLTN